jgi:hypothetical protein
MLQIGPVVFDDNLAQLPPAPLVPAPALRATLLEAIATSPESVIVSGLSASYPVRFASAPSLGWVTPVMRTALIDLYRAGDTFTLITDLLGERGPGKETTYNGVFFEPGVPPQFGPHEVPDGKHWHFDISVRIPYA